MNVVSVRDFRDRASEMVRSDDVILVMREGRPAGFYLPWDAPDLPKDLRREVLLRLTEQIADQRQGDARARVTRKAVVQAVKTSAVVVRVRFAERMGLFGRNDEKDAREATAAAETERLVSLPVDDLAVEVMRAFGPDGLGTRSGNRQGPIEVSSWLLSSFSNSAKYRQPVLGPVIESLQSLENAGLLTRRSFGGNGSHSSTYHATRLGEDALAENAVRRYLAPARDS